MNWEILRIYEGLKLTKVQRCLFETDYNSNSQQVRDQKSDGNCILEFEGKKEPLVIDALTERLSINLSNTFDDCGKFSFLKDVSNNSFWRIRLDYVKNFNYLVDNDIIFGLAIIFSSSPNCYIYYVDAFDACIIGDETDIDKNYLRDISTS